MALRKFPAIIFLSALALPLVSCLHSGRPGADPLRSARITISEGNAVLTIRAQVSQDLHAEVFWGAQKFDQQIVQSGSITRTETRRLSAGEEITFWLMPSEVISVSIVSADGSDVEVTIRPPRGGERTRSLSGTSKMGIIVSF